MPVSYIGDIGTVIEIDTQNDLTEATDLEILIKKPDGTILEKEAVIPEGLDPADGKISYVIIAGDLDIAGTYKAQPRITGTGTLHRGLTAEFKVREHFA